MEEIIMKNVVMAVKGSILTITVDLAQNFGASSTGKSIIIASSEGNQNVPNSEAKVGLNIFKYIPR
jgi:hypothetical protein